MFQTIYYNLQTAKSARIFKKTAIIKDQNKEKLEISSVITIRHLSTQFDDENPIDIKYSVVNKEMISSYVINGREFNETDTNSVHIIDNRRALDDRMIDKIRIGNPETESFNEAKKIVDVLPKASSKSKKDAEVLKRKYQ